MDFRGIFINNFGWFATFQLTTAVDIPPNIYFSKVVKLKTHRVVFPSHLLIPWK